MPKIYQKKSNLFCKLFELDDENKEWILEYLSGGKGVKPYKKIKLHEDLNCVPKGKFFDKSEFYSSLKNKIILNQGYENVKKF